MTRLFISLDSGHMLILIELISFFTKKFSMISTIRSMTKSETLLKNCQCIVVFVHLKVHNSSNQFGLCMENTIYALLVTGNNADGAAENFHD